MKLEEIKKTHESWMEEAVYQCNRAEKAEAEFAEEKKQHDSTLRGLSDAVHERDDAMADNRRLQERVRELEGALGNARKWLKEIQTYPIAMKALGHITKDRIEGAVFQADQALQHKEGE